MFFEQQQRPRGREIEIREDDFRRFRCRLLVEPFTSEECCERGLGSFGRAAHREDAIQDGIDIGTLYLR